MLYSIKDFFFYQYKRINIRQLNTYTQGSVTNKSLHNEQFKNVLINSFKSLHQVCKNVYFLFLLVSCNFK